MPGPDEMPALAEGVVVAGKFRVVRLLGAGGMGAVYEVEHELTKHRRALKLLFARRGESPSAVERFLREASAAGRIANAHIAETFDAGTLDSGETYLVMELLEGETFEHRRERLGRLDIVDLASLIRQACVGIQAAHDAGIVHRDLKPENLYVTTRDGAPFVKILDFGISKFDEGRTGVIGVTAEGTVMGTPFYMSPEQVVGDASIDLRTDVYSLGVILYECAAGRRPFEADTLSHLAVKIHEGKATPLGEHRPDLPPGFADVVAQAMAHDRTSRFGSARELGAALAPFANDAMEDALGDTLPTDAPKVVIRSPSGPPPSLLPPAARLHESATFATAATTPAVPPQTTRSATLRALGIVALAVVATVVVASSLRSRGASSTPPSATPAASPRSSPTAEPPPVSLSSVEPEPSPSPSAPASVGLSTSSARPAVVVATAPAASSAKPSSSAPRTRVDQKGLAGENPFR
jgi:serine/threonine protein kinase